MGAAIVEAYRSHSDGSGQRRSFGALERVFPGACLPGGVARSMSAGRKAEDYAVRAARDDRIFEMYLAGISARKIADCFGMDKSSVLEIIRTLRAMLAEQNTDEAEDSLPCPPRPKGFGAVKAKKLKIPPLEQGKLYSLPEFCDKNRRGGRRPPARIMQFIGFVPGAGVRHALFLHPVAGYRETFRDIDLARMKLLRRVGR